MQFVSSATVPYFLPLVKYQLSYTRIHACGRKPHTSERLRSVRVQSVTAVLDQYAAVLDSLEEIKITATLPLLPFHL